MELAIQGVGKRYRNKVWALQDFDLVLTPGILGLLGPNGAGKSTLMRILSAITRPTTGKVLWNGASIAESPTALRKVLGYLPQDFGVYPNLNAVEFLEYIAILKGLNRSAAHKRISELLELVHLSDVQKRPLGSYSGGMRQRIGIAQALLNDPSLLIVDEPTVGLDPEERVRFRNLLTELSGERIVILSTHIVSDIEASASHIAIVNKGRLLTHSSPEALLAQSSGMVWEWMMPSSSLPDAQKKYAINSALRTKDGVKVRVVSAEQPHPEAAQVQPTIEDAYLCILLQDRAGGAL